MIKGVLFDMDGVMFDTEQMGLDIWAQLGKQHGFEMPHEVWLSVLGLRFEEIAQVIQESLGPSFPFWAYWEELKRIIDRQISLHGMPKKPGLVPLLDYLKEQGYRFTVATSTLRSRVENYMNAAGVRAYFGEIVCGDMVKRSKPAPDIYEKAAQTIGLLPEECIALEDSPRGILSAYRAGVHPVFIPDLLTIDQETESLLYAKVSSLFDIIPLLARERSTAEERK